MKIKFLDLLEEDAAIQISTILYIVTYGLTYKYNVAKYFFILISIIFCYNLVKKYFKSEFDAGLEADLIPVNKKVIDGATEDVYHPRSRSAKLRVAMKK